MIDELLENFDDINRRKLKRLNEMTVEELLQESKLLRDKRKEKMNNLNESEQDSFYDDSGEFEW